MRVFILSLLLCFSSSIYVLCQKWNPGHYIFVGVDVNITQEHLKTTGFRGIQKAYLWKKLEPTQGKYDFTDIKNDLVLVSKKGMKLVIQIQWKSFEKGKTYGPNYLMKDSNYVYYGNQENDVNPPINPRVWDPYVTERFNKLIAELGKEFDKNPDLEVVNLPESSASATAKELTRTGFYSVDSTGKIINDRRKQLAYLTSNMLALKAAFPNTVVIQYMNYPISLFTLNKIHEFIGNNGIGMGGPDIRWNDKDLTNGVYKYYAPLAGKVPLGTAVQWPDYDFGGVSANVADFYKIGKDVLHLNYIFWHIREPWWKEVKTLVDSLTTTYGPTGGLDSTMPVSVKL